MSEPPAIEALVRTHLNGIWRYLRFLGCEPGEADDLTQETFLAVLRRPFRSPDAAAEAAYLRTVARHRFLDARRKGPRELPPEAADEVWDRFAARDGGESYLEALRSCLGELDDRSREALEARYGSGRGRAEAAAELGISGEGVKTLLRRARERLRRCIEGRFS